MGHLLLEGIRNTFLWLHVRNIWNFVYGPGAGGRAGNETAVTARTSVKRAVSAVTQPCQNTTLGDNPTLTIFFDISSTLLSI